MILLNSNNVVKLIQLIYIVRLIMNLYQLSISTNNKQLLGRSVQENKSNISLNLLSLGGNIKLIYDENFILGNCRCSHMKL